MSGRTLARAGMIVAGAYFVSRILGYVRVVVITNEFGASAQLDAYFAAFRVPDTIFQLVAAGAFGSSMVPVLAGIFGKGEDERGWRVVSTVINVMLIVLATLATIVAVFAPQIVPIITPGFDSVGTELTIRLTRILLMSPVLLALAAVASSSLNVRGRFASAAVAPSLYNVSIIVGAVLLGPVLGVEGLAIGVVIGSLLHLAIQIRPLIREKFRLSLKIDLSDPAVRQILTLMIPRAIGLGANQIVFMVATMLATGVGLGAVTDYNVAMTLLQIPLGTISFPMSLVLMPTLSRAAALGSTKEWAQLLVRSMRLIAWIMFFITALGIVLRRQGVTLLFDPGLNEQAISLTSDTLSFMLLGLTGLSLVIILARAFYSGQDTRTPVLTAFIDLAVAISLGVALVGSMGLSGIALGLSAGAWAEALMLGILLWRRMPAMGIESVIRPLLMFALGAILAGVVMLVAVRFTDPLIGATPGKILLLGQILIVSALGGLTYAAYTRLLGIPELNQVISLLRSSLRRGGSKPTIADVETESELTGGPPGMAD
ncbi:MAG TPA: murein biosynthesis integral membrane protein MurJ [Candidatus Limnocylindria bacterium]|nr:murein biosynthesis integral membrane protein MurJ [Candidatus Limnocylindria bacterium]